MLYYDYYSKVFRDNENNAYFLNVKTYNGRFSVNLLNFMPCTKKQFSMLLDIVSEDIENEKSHISSLKSFLCSCIEVLEYDRENVHDTTQKAKYNTLLKKYNAFYNDLAARYNLEIKTDPENVKYKSVFVYALHVDGAKRFSGFSFEKYGKTFHVYKNDHKQWNVIVPDTGLKLTSESTKQKAVLLITPDIMKRLEELTGTEKYNTFRKQFYDAMVAAGFDYVLEDNSIYNYHEEPENEYITDPVLNNIDVKELLRRFRAIYSHLYENDNIPENGTENDYRNAVAFFDNHLNDKRIKLLCDFNSLRHDFISSDREAAAFTLAFFELYEKAKKEPETALKHTTTPETVTTENYTSYMPETVTTSNRKENALKRHIYAAMLLCCYNGHITPYNAKTTLYSRTITAYTTTPYNGRTTSYNRHIGKYSATPLKRLKTAYNKLCSATAKALCYHTGSVTAGRYTFIVPAGYSSIPWNTSTATPLYNDSS